MSRKRGYRGTIGRALVHGESLDSALAEASDDWIKGVSAAKDRYAEGLKEYLGFYLSGIEQKYAEILNDNPDYFSDANRTSRQYAAMQIMDATHELAAEWRKKKARDIVQKKMQALQGYSKWGRASSGTKTKTVEEKVVSSQEL